MTIRLRLHVQQLMCRCLITKGQAYSSLVMTSYCSDSCTPPGVDKSCAKALFCFSQATVSDELGKRQRAVSLAFFDFVEVSVMFRL